MLDVGCGVGTRLAIFRELGWHVEGLEMDKRSAGLAAGLGYKIYSTSLEKADLPEDYFDAIYLNNVFEHLADPLGSLTRIVSALKDNGQLILVVPNSSSLAFRLFRQHWFALEVPRHLFTYSRENLTRLIRKCGFEVQKVIYTNTLGSLSSSLSYKLNKPVDSFSFLERPFWLLNLLLDPVCSALGIGDWMTMRATLKKK